MKLAAIYIRVSTKKQSKGNANSYEMQEQKCIDWCKDNGYEIFKIYKDVESGGKDDRIEFNKLFSDISKKIFNLVVFNEVSRIARKSSTGMKFFEELEMYNIPFYAITQPFIQNKLMLTIYIGMSTQEREQISLRQKSMFYERAKIGLKPTGKAPLGYYVENKKLYIIDEEAEIVRDIFNYFLKTLSVGATANKFGKTRKNLRYILENKTYIGYIPYGKYQKSLYGIIKESKGEYFKSDHIPIIDNDTWEKVQYILTNNLTVYNSNLTNKHENKLLFTGLLICPKCGTKMFRNPYHYKYKNVDKYIYYYRCSNEKCLHSINATLIEDNIISELKNLSFINSLKKDNKKDNKRIEKLKVFIENYDIKRKKMLDLYRKNVITMEELEDSFKKIEDEVLEAKKELEVLVSTTNQNNISKISNLEKLKFVLENYSEIDVPEIRKMLKFLIKNISFTSDNTFKINLL